MVLFTFEKVRPPEGFKNHIEGFKGKFQTDGYKAYEKNKEIPDYILFSC
ncbi:MAG: transposase [Saprospiraceae bacterium]|nr:transposase [Saprospiraceae bacterium]